MNAILHKYLKDFSLSDPVNPMDADPLHADDLSCGLLENGVEPEPAIDIEALCEAARLEGHESATSELTARHETEIATLAAVHRGEIDAVQHLFEIEIARLVEERFSSMSLSLSATLYDNVFKLLLPLIDVEMARKSVSELATLVGEMLGEGENRSLVIKGPVGLFGALQHKLADCGISCRHVPSASMDLTVGIDEGVLVTRLAAWRDSLSESLK